MSGVHTIVSHSNNDHTGYVFAFVVFCIFFYFLASAQKFCMSILYGQPEALIIALHVGWHDDIFDINEKKILNSSYTNSWQGYVDLMRCYTNRIWQEQINEKAK